jgi:microcystin-dependent protein
MANPTLLTMPLCRDADKNTIPATDAGTAGIFSEQYGWQAVNSLPLSAGGKAVQRQDFNGVFALLGGIAYACQRGQSFEWVNNLPYLAGCVVIDPLDGNKYNAKNDVAEGGTNPSLDPTNWELFGKVDGFDIGDLKFTAHNGAISDGWLVCDGSAISRTTYAELFDVIGTTYGVGDGTTTFNLPDYTDKFTEGGATAGVEKQAGLPNITGTFKHSCNALFGQSGLFTVEGFTTTQPNNYINASNVGSLTTFDASKSNPIYGNSDTVQPPALTCRVLIKYE